MLTSAQNFLIIFSIIPLTGSIHIVTYTCLFICVVTQAPDDHQPKLNPNSVRFGDVAINCLLLIMSHLSFMDIVNVAHTCTHFKSIVYDFVYTNINHFEFGVGQFSSVNNSNVDTALREIGPHIKSIQWTDLTSIHLQLVLANCPNLRALKLINPCHVLHNQVIKRYIEFFKSMKSLTLVRCSIFDGPLKLIISNASITSLH